MRTLKQEIAHCREKGLCRNTIELSTMLAWLGERVTEDEERKELVAALEGERIKTAVVFDGNAVWKAIPDRVKEWTNVDHLTAVLDAVAKVMKRSSQLRGCEAVPLQPAPEAQMGAFVKGKMK